VACGCELNKTGSARQISAVRTDILGTSPRTITAFRITAPHRAFLTVGKISAQVSAIQKGFAGPKNMRCKQVYPGFPFDTGIAACGTGVIPGLLNPGPSPVGGPNFSLELDVDEAAAAMAAS
jgi:hypothetical protein